MRKKLLAVILCAALLIVGLAATASAYDEIPDLEKKGSISMDVLTADKEAIGGGTLTAYLTAELKETDGVLAFVYTDAFSSIGTIVDADEVNSAPAGAPELAAKLAALTEGAEGITVPVDENGHADFSDLPLGLYLITQDEPAEGFEPLEPFVITVPFWDGEKLVYDVSALPKPAPAYNRPVLDPPVMKRISYPAGSILIMDYFTFELMPREPGYPMPENPEGTFDSATGAMRITHYGPGEFELGEISFTLDDVGHTYVYTIREIPGRTVEFTYDQRTYTMTVVVSMEAGEIQYSVSYVSSDNAIVDEMVFNNVQSMVPPPTEPTQPTQPTEPPTEPTIPTIPTVPTSPPDTPPTPPDNPPITPDNPPVTPDTPTDIDVPDNPTPLDEYTDLIDIDDLPTPLAELPKTGQLWWPVPLMGIMGLLLFGIGWVTRRRSHEAN